MKYSTYNTYEKGWAAEQDAINYLCNQGYDILHHRYKTPYGELDIIAQYKKLLVFVEVKYRPTKEEGMFAIQPKQKKRLQHAALFYLDHLDQEIRFDVILITRNNLFYYENMISFEDVY